MNMKKIFKDVINFFSLTDDEISAKHEKPQEIKNSTKEKIYTFNDLKFTHDNYSGMVYANIEFKNGYHMYISVKNYTEGLDQEFLKHEAPAGYEITIIDREGKKNTTCLNKDGEVVVYNKNAVTTLMKQIQQLDEKGHLPAMRNNDKTIEARKKHLLKMRERRKAIEKNLPETSGVIAADRIAEKVICGEEKRTITPAVAIEYRKKEARNQ